MTPAWSVQRALPEQAFDAIQQAIERSEGTHRGEVRFAVEGSLDLFDLLRGMTACERALQVFSQLGVWDTEENNGVLIYLLLADRDFVTPEDVKSVAVIALAHRIVLKPEYWVRGISDTSIIEAAMNEVPTPQAEAQPARVR